MKTFATENAVDPAVHVYVPRSQDELLIEKVETAALCHVQGSRMSGKSSLLVRTAERLRESGALAVYADLHTLETSDPEDELRLVRLLLATLARRAGLTPPACLDDDGLIVPADMFATGLRELALSHASALGTGARHTRVVVMLDEFDVVGEARWGGGFISVLRDFTARRASDPILGRVHIVIAGVRPFRHLVNDPAAAGVAPNESIWLDDFPNDAASAAALVEGFPTDLADDAPTLAWKALEFSGGYPQACAWLCAAMVREHMAADLADLELRLVRFAERERRASQAVGFFSYPEDYLRSYARESGRIADTDPLATSLDALWVYQDLLARRDVQFDASRPSHDLLRWAGLARCDQTGILRSRSPLLERFYTLDWATNLRRSIEATRVWVSAPRNGDRSLPKVCVLTTGGTIGMVEDAQTGKVRAPTSLDDLGVAFATVNHIAQVEYVPALDAMRDSANIVPEHWSMLSQLIAERVADREISGVVVAHGTDTLAYTASAVAYALGERLTKPVVFTGSQATVDVVHGDALMNLLRSCKVAAEAGAQLPEVVICFGDKVLRACRAQKRDDRNFDAFESPLWPPLAIITEEIEYAERTDILTVRGGTAPPLELRAHFDSRILTVAQVPGLRPKLLEPVLESGDAGDGLRGIVIQSLGAGNLPTEAGYSLVSFIAKAVERDIPVVLGSPYPVLMSNPEKYAPAEAAIKAGALPLFNITLPALVTKFAWILGDMPSEFDHADPHDRLRIGWVHERIRTNYIGETDDVTAAADLATTRSATSQ